MQAPFGETCSVFQLESQGSLLRPLGQHAVAWWLALRLTQGPARHPTRMMQQLEMEWRRSTGRGRTVGPDPDVGDTGSGESPGVGGMWTELATHHAAGSGHRSRSSEGRAPCIRPLGLLCRKAALRGPEPAHSVTDTPSTLQLQLDLLVGKAHALMRATPASVRTPASWGAAVL